VVFAAGAKSFHHGLRGLSRGLRGKQAVSFAGGKAGGNLVWMMDLDPSAKLVLGRDLTFRTIAVAMRERLARSCARVFSFKK
jgi:hypothetical protein